MYLQRLALKNFKCFDEFNIEFHRNLTVIAGVNGSGKTSVLEGIALALSAMFTSMEGTKSRGIDKKHVRLKAYSFGTVSDVQAQYPVVLSASAEIDGNHIDWGRSLNTPKGLTTTGDAKPIISLGERFQERLRDGDATLILPIIAYYGTGRLWDYHREKQNDIFASSTRTNGYINSVDGVASVKLMMNWFEKMTILNYQNKESGQGRVLVLDAVLSAMNECYRMITGLDDVKIQYNMGTRELDASFTDEDGNRMRIPINQLSDGYKSTISLVADIAYRMAVLNPQLMGDVCKLTDGIVLIDEVDLHLHPSWQQRILEDLTTLFPKVQFIVTTHAPAVLNTIRSENLVLLEECKAFYPAGEVYGRDVNTILRGTMQVNERPEVIVSMFAQFHDALSRLEFDKAEKILDDIAKEINEDDADLSACRLKLKLRKLRGN